MSQQFCLKWNNHMNNMMDVFKNLLSTEAMVDVTLACDGLSLKAHKIVLSACSPFFQSLFLENPCKHPIVILKDMKYTELKAIIEFMYHGEVNVAQEKLSALMKTAETLRVKGLAEVTNDKEQSGDESSHRPSSRTGTPPSKRKKGRTRKRSISDQSDDEASQSKTSRHQDSDIEELSSDIDHNVNKPYSTASTVPSQTHRTNSFHKSRQEHSVEQHAGDSFVEEKFSVEPVKLLQQTLATDDLPRHTGRSSVASNMELQRRPQSSTDHSIVPVTSTPLSSDALVSDHQPESPIDIKPELLDLEPPMSPVAGPSHSADENSMMYMDQSNMSSMSGPSGYQDNSGALAPSDSQPQEKCIDKKVRKSDVKRVKFAKSDVKRVKFAKSDVKRVKSAKSDVKTVKFATKQGNKERLTVQFVEKGERNVSEDTQLKENADKLIVQYREKEVENIVEDNLKEANKQIVVVDLTENEEKDISEDTVTNSTGNLPTTRLVPVRCVSTGAVRLMSSETVSIVVDPSSTRILGDVENQEKNSSSLGIGVRKNHSTRNYSGCHAARTTSFRDQNLLRDSTGARNNLATTGFASPRSVNTRCPSLTDKMVSTVVNASPTGIPGPVNTQERNSSILVADVRSNNSDLDDTRTTSLRDPTLLPGFDGQHIDDSQIVDDSISGEDDFGGTIPMGALGMLHLLQPVCGVCWAGDFDKKYDIK